MPKFPYFGFPNPFYRSYRYYPNYQMPQTSTNYSNTSNSKEPLNHNYNNNLPPKTQEKLSSQREQATSNNSREEEAFFDLFGIKLHFDDILLVALIYFLYNEGVKDEGLFLALILLLLT